MQLPSLGRLSLPTAGRKAARKRGEREAASAVANAEVIDSSSRDEWVRNNNIMYKGMADAKRRAHNVRALVEIPHVLDFLWNLIQFWYQNEFWIPEMWEPHGINFKIWALHRELVSGKEGGPADAVDMDDLMHDKFYEMSIYLFNNYVIHTFPEQAPRSDVYYEENRWRGANCEYRKWLNAQNAGAAPVLRGDQDEMERIINQPDTKLLLMGVKFTFDRFFPQGKLSDDEFLVTTNDYWRRVVLYFKHTEARARLAAMRVHTPRGARPAPELQNRAPFEDMQNAAAAREAKEAAARLAAKTNEDTRRRRDREQRMRAAQRLEEQDGRRRREAGGPSSAPSDWETAKAELRAQEDNQIAQDAKTKDIAERRARIEVQLVAAREAQAEQAVREAARTHALEIADNIQKGK